MTCNRRVIKIFDRIEFSMGQERFFSLPCPYRISSLLFNRYGSGPKGLRQSQGLVPISRGTLPLLLQVFWQGSFIHRYFHLLPLWSSGQCSWLQIQKSGFDSRCYQIFWEVVGLIWDPLSLMSTTEEPLERKSRSYGLEMREHGRRDPSR
jgi:hypothetical protein